MKKKILAAVIGVLIVMGVIAYNKLALFVIQPIGAIPEGVTIVVERQQDMPFIDSADAMCERRTGKVSLFCRGIALSEITKVKIYAKLPYSDWLYLQSTGGVRYGN